MKDLDISESCLHNWMTQANSGESGSSVRLSIAEKKELAELCRKNRQLELGNEILKRAATISRERTCSRSNVPAGGNDVVVACRVLNMPRSGHYEWRDRPISGRARQNELLLK
ncbi:hypothetical protein ACFXPA_45235 [Amycolatopsis sp. NPDC059090]|uniref:hypothetical protein n=1 Tax=Amycolatopsis sp. NPDC059090 TaxID=3346723 RepID=UPI0036700B59